MRNSGARKVHKGDKIIIIAYANMDIKESEEYSPAIVIVDDENNVIDELSHL